MLRRTLIYVSRVAIFTGLFPVVSKFHWFPNSNGFQFPVASWFQRFPKSSGLASNWLTWGSIWHTYTQRERYVAFAEGQRAFQWFPLYSHFRRGTTGLLVVSNLQSHPDSVCLKFSIFSWFQRLLKSNGLQNPVVSKIQWFLIVSKFRWFSFFKGSQIPMGTSYSRLRTLDRCSYWPSLYVSSRALAWV